MFPHFIFRRAPPEFGQIANRRRTASNLTALTRQNKAMSTTKKERWTEVEVLALPAGEHDYFDRKSGLLLADQDFRKDLAKALSAFANSGGGHLLLGVKNDGSFDGVEPYKNKTPTREWLEQVVQNLLSYPLEDFRVHEVESSSPSVIPQGRVVIVIDVGDSVMAPHQTSTKPYTYYYRAGGHSESAPHFYLETLRNRLTNPLLKAELIEVGHVNIKREANEWLFVSMNLTFRITNAGRVAAYKWALIINYHNGGPDNRTNDYVFQRHEFLGVGGGRSGIRVDPTILPSLSETEVLPFGVYLRPTKSWDSETIRAEFESMIPQTFRLGYRIVTETSPGEVIETSFGDVLDYPEILKRILERV